MTEESGEKKLSLVDHLDEFRKGVILSVVSIILTTCFMFAFVKTLLPILIRPAGKLVFIAPQEAFVANIKVAFFSGLFISFPFVLYQIWKFVAIGLSQQERKYIRIFGPLSFLFFVVGACFCFFVIAPISMKFLLGFGSDLISPMITVSKYISFVGTLTLTFGVVFELPLVTLFFTKIGVITPRFLTEKRKVAIVGMFILSAILTPPDMITQCLMAVPLLFLYELGIIFSKLAYKKTPH